MLSFQSNPCLQPFFNPLWSADLHPNKWSFINSGEIYPIDFLQCPFNDGNEWAACDKRWREKFVLNWYYLPVTWGFTEQRYIWAPALCLIVHDAQEIQKLRSDGPSLAWAPRWMNSFSWHCFESLLCIRHCTCCWGNNSEQQKKSPFQGSDTLERRADNKHSGCSEDKWMKRNNDEPWEINYPREADQSRGDCTLLSVGW